MKHNEDTRVKIPTVLHLGRLGYTYLSLKDDTNSKEDTNQSKRKPKALRVTRLVVADANEWSGYCWGGGTK